MSFEGIMFNRIIELLHIVLAIPITTSTAKESFISVIVKQDKFLHIS